MSICLLTDYSRSLGTNSFVYTASLFIKSKNVKDIHTTMFTINFSSFIQWVLLRSFQRAIEESNTQEANKPSYCHRSTPCGWAIYVPFTREIVHFMPNT